mmetsp:Transcript_87697/g.128279  ORF Transcript_87697/g.128279 Transcript_87697/m.128279 type:complete len:870 (+) Transcript_87697:45-2654(+)
MDGWDENYVPQVQEFPVVDVVAVEAVLRRAEPGQYIIYRANEDVKIPNNSFEAVCVSFQTEDYEPGHNLVYFNTSAFDAWAPFIGWVTIHPEPWHESDPVALLQSNMLFPSIEALCDILPELTQRLDARTGVIITDATLASANSNGGGRRDLTSTLKSAVAPPIEGVEGLAKLTGKGGGRFSYEEQPQVLGDPHKPRDWMGDREDKGLYQLLPWSGYILSTAITATASRYGGELPGLVRVLVSHNHIRSWTEELTSREMTTATPLGLLQVESQSMVLWLVITEVSGCPFLTRALGPIINNILNSRETFELDPSLNRDELPIAAGNIQAAVKAILDSLNAQVEAFPHCCAIVLYTLEQSISRQFGVMASSTVARYLFHRFILEALLAPSAVGLSDVRPTPDQLRSLSTLHQVLEKAATPEGSFSRADARERHLIPLNNLLPIARTKLSAFLQTVLSMGAPYSPMMAAAASNGGVVYMQADMDVVSAFLRNHYVEVYSAIVDMRSDRTAAELSSRLRPVLFGGANKGPNLPIGEVPPKPHPMGLTTSAYQTALPPPIGSIPNEIVALSQLEENALPPPGEASNESYGMGANAMGTGIPTTHGKLGVGIIFRKDPYGLFHVLTIAKGSPAETSGVIVKGDVLMNINGHSAVGMSLAQIKSYIVGPPGTPVKLIFERPQGSTTFRFEVCLFRGHTKGGSKQLAPSTYVKHPNEDSKVWHEMTKIFSEVEELQQRRARAEKAFHAAEQLRQEYETAAKESEARAEALRNEVDQVRLRLEKVLSEKQIIEQDIVAQKMNNSKPKGGIGMGGGAASFLSNPVLTQEKVSITAPPQPSSVSGPEGIASGTTDGSWGLGIPGLSGDSRNGQPQSCTQQ